MNPRRERRRVQTDVADLCLGSLLNGFFLNSRKSMPGSRKAWCERSILILAIAFVIGLCSCGIRPLNRADHDVPGWVTTFAPETDPPDTVLYDQSTPETERTYYREPDLDDRTINWEYSYLVDEKYIAEHTLGYYYLKNKGFDLYYTTLYQNSDSKNPPLESGDGRMESLEYANKFCMIELDHGYIGLVTCNPVLYGHRCALSVFTFAQLQEGQVVKFERQHLIIKKTTSGAYSISSWALDETNGCCLTAEWFRPAEPGQEYTPFIKTYTDKQYTDDEDYSDEWLFIPAEPPETTAP